MEVVNLMSQSDGRRAPPIFAIAAQSDTAPVIGLPITGAVSQCRLRPGTRNVPAVT